MKEDKKYIEQLETTKGFAGILNIKDLSIYHATDKVLAATCETLDEHYTKKYPNGITAADVDYYPVERDMESVVEISFTSGTTSATSKGVVLPARSLSVNLEFAQREIPVAKGGHIFAILPMAHMFGQTFDVLFPLSSGCHVHVMPGKPTPARLLGGLGAVKPFMFLSSHRAVQEICRTLLHFLKKYPIGLL